MAKKTAEKKDNLTLEERLALAEERAAKAEAEKLAAEKALEASKENNPNAKLVVPGVYKSTKTKKNYGFKLGNVSVRKKDGSVAPAVEVLEDAETMEWLIKIGSAIIEEK